MNKQTDRQMKQPTNQEMTQQITISKKFFFLQRRGEEEEANGKEDKGREDLKSKRTK